MEIIIEFISGTLVSFRRFLKHSLRGGLTMKIKKESEDFNDINTVLDKMLQLEKSKNRVNI